MATDGSKKNNVKRMFDSISKQYDFLNHLLSAGIDFYWRKKALKYTGLEKNAILLDVACGTGDFSIAANKFGVANIFGADLSLGMLKVFPKKHPAVIGRLTQTEAELLPFVNESFTNVIVAFGVRNFHNIPKAFNDFHRVLKNNGKVTVLEFSLPKNILIKSIYMFYFTRLLPLVGKFFSKDKSAYTYLPDSVKEFDDKINLPDLLIEAGFNSVKRYKLTFGIVQIVIGQS